jgi:uncharacterized protein (TIGR02145 family)
MGTKLSKGKRFFAPTLAAVLAFALAFAFTGCGSNDNNNNDDGGGSSSSGGDDPNSSSLLYQGKTYKTVVIGEQTWMAENLNYDVGNSKCYDNNNANCAKYGRLYDWATAMTVCPHGWHLPSHADWDKLYHYAGGTSGTSSPYRSSIAGKYLKATSGWNEPGNGEDKFGFSALPGGNGNSGDIFSLVGIYGYWWSSSEFNSNYAYYRNMFYNNEGACDEYGDKSYLYSVRCVKD